MTSTTITDTVETPALDAAARLIEIGSSIAGRRDYDRLEECITIAKSSAASGNAEAVAFLEEFEARLATLASNFYCKVMDEGAALLAPHGEYRSVEDAFRTGDWVRP